MSSVFINFWHLTDGGRFGGLESERNILVHANRNDIWYGIRGCVSVSTWKASRSVKFIKIIHRAKAVGSVVEPYFLQGFSNILVRYGKHMYYIPARSVKKWNSKNDRQR